MSTVETTGLKKDVEKWREVLVITDSVLGWDKVGQGYINFTVHFGKYVFPGAWDCALEPNTGP
jgi:hypothetical protein